MTTAELSKIRNMYRQEASAPKPSPQSLSVLKAITATGNGRRINIIPYVASQFRKDKIWLRRTKPAQLSRALTLLEGGGLSVLLFGERPQTLLNHTEQFDRAKLVNPLDFS
uniref:Uncharacterized protein n=1 Tax=Glossina palpalis gambiensis TaxID=67801 RepID=A0A1B0BWT9_9MUSC